MKENTTKSNRPNLSNLLENLWSEGSIEYPVKILRWRLSPEERLQDLGDAIYKLFEDFYIAKMEENGIGNNDDDWLECLAPHENSEAEEETFDDYVKRKKKEKEEERKKEERL
jgi:hypothetical protein